MNNFLLVFILLIIVSCTFEEENPQLTRDEMFKDGDWTFFEKNTTIFLNNHKVNTVGDISIIKTRFLLTDSNEVLYKKPDSANYSSEKGKWSYDVKDSLININFEANSISGKVKEITNTSLVIETISIIDTVDRYGKKALMRKIARVTYSH